MSLKRIHSFPKIPNTANSFGYVKHITNLTFLPANLAKTQTVLFKVWFSEYLVMYQY